MKHEGLSAVLLFFGPGKCGHRFHGNHLLHILCSNVYHSVPTGGAAAAAAEILFHPPAGSLLNWKQGEDFNWLFKRVHQKSTPWSCLKFYAEWDFSLKNKSEKCGGGFSSISQDPDFDSFGLL